MSDEIADILVLPTGYQPDGLDLPARREPRDWAKLPCRHTTVSVNPETRKATCCRCDQEVDPFDHLLSMADGWRGYQRRLDEAARRVRSAEEAAARRVKEIERRRPKVAMPVGKRLARIARSVQRAQGELAEAQAQLVRVLEDGRIGYADFSLSAARDQIDRALSSIEKLKAGKAELEQLVVGTRSP